MRADPGRPGPDAPPDDHVTDGRLRKGLQRRRLLISATLRVIERAGSAAVTQRRVAREAGLPPSAVTYYFPTIDDLLVATLTACNDSYIERIAAFPDDDARALEALAELIATSTSDSRADVAAEYELYLMAARRPDMRAELGRWTRAVDAFLARYVSDPVERSGVTAAVDGLFLRGLAAEEPPTAGEYLAILRRLVRRD